MAQGREPDACVTAEQITGCIAMLRNLIGRLEAGG